MVRGTDIKRLREAAGISQADLAQAAGVSPSWLCALEAGRRDAGEAEGLNLIGVIQRLWDRRKQAVAKQLEKLPMREKATEGVVA